MERESEFMGSLGGVTTSVAFFFFFLMMMRKMNANGCYSKVKV